MYITMYVIWLFLVFVCDLATFSIKEITSDISVFIHERLVG